MPDELTQGENFIPLLRTLGVRVIAPFEILHEGSTVRFDAHLPDFGGKKGMVLLLNCRLDSFEKTCMIAEAAGLYYSALNGSAETSEAKAKDTLDDWGFYGPESLRPAWYTGKPWC